MKGTSGKMIHISPGTQIPDSHDFPNSKPIPGFFLTSYQTLSPGRMSVSLSFCVFVLTAPMPELRWSDYKQKAVHIHC